jgi:FkbM family methyltransferase
LLAKNLRLNALEDRVVVVAAAVGDAVGVATFYTAGARNENSLIPTALPSDVHATTLSVPVTSLDAYFAERGRDPAVIKIDVEGAEFSVLRGADRIVRSSATIFCELHPYAWLAAGHSAEALRAWLAERGRRMFDLRTGVESEELRYGVYEIRRVT